jgi:hypothetical protein
MGYSSFFGVATTRNHAPRGSRREQPGCWFCLTSEATGERAKRPLGDLVGVVTSVLVDFVGVFIVPFVSRVVVAVPTQCYTRLKSEKCRGAGGRQAKFRVSLNERTKNAIETC